MQIEKNELCCGCGACANVCPKQAVIMKEDEKGFLKPVIETSICIECGICDKTCPQTNYKSENNSEPKVFAFINKNDEERAKSSSGAVFPLFAKNIFEQSGVVFGVIWDENIQAVQSCATTFEEIDKMRGSKYVQSDTKNTYKQAKEELEKGKIVLYTGTPCHIAGLKSYLRKDYENLLTIDVICHGTPSRKIFEMYKKEFLLKQKDKGKILDIKFRSKSNGWHSGSFTTTTTTTKGIYNIGSPQYDNHMKAFDISLNISCLNCMFNKLPRVADITMGDFWGVDDFDKTLNDGKGTSIILINSEKGQKWFEKVKNECFYKEVPIEVAIKGNPNIVGSSKAHKDRDKFFKDIIAGKSLEKTVNKYIKSYPNFLKFIYKKLLPPFIKNIIKRFL